ncbi:hypothetical protein [Xanthomonas citri]|uniref:hypothetical protein n=1 Tax=Xanthomonas citri TaxID=346 RepID=UPI000F7A0440|nr:hypothetical protein [Xanthomonas citri]
MSKPKKMKKGAEVVKRDSALVASMTGGQGASINGANISHGAVGSDGRIVSGASLDDVSAQGGLSGRTRQAAANVGGQAAISRASSGGGQHQRGEKHHRQRGCAG